LDAQADEPPGGFIVPTGDCTNRIDNLAVRRDAFMTMFYG
jgi:hypothetical protein